MTVSASVQSPLVGAGALCLPCFLHLQLQISRVKHE
jgi:hypothetical protein